MTAKTQTEHKDTYHHGNLRESLLSTALEFLQTDTLDNLSLRALAKRVGVSPTAVYSHFADKIELLIDVRTLGFRQLSEHLSRALAQEPEACGEQKVRLLGLGYMSFALQHPHLFDALFSWTPDLSRMKSDCIEASMISECLLQDAICQMFHERGVEPTKYQAAVASFSAWSHVHGLTMLVRSGGIEGAVHCGNWPETFSCQHPESQQRVFEHMLTIQIEGLKTSIDQLIP